MHFMLGLDFRGRKARQRIDPKLFRDRREMDVERQLIRLVEAAYAQNDSARTATANSSCRRSGGWSALSNTACATFAPTS